MSGPTRTPLSSAGLVALQFALIGVLLASARPPGAGIVLLVALALLCASAALGIAALAANRPGNFNIRPELKAGARLVTSGIYRRIRHPMYLAVMVGMLGIVFADPRPWRFLVWTALVGVLIAKLRREEGYLAHHFAPYAEYCSRTWRLLPWLW